MKVSPAHVLRFVELVLFFAKLINSCNTKTLLGVSLLVCRPYYLLREKKFELMFEKEMVFEVSLYKYFIQLKNLNIKITLKQENNKYLEIILNILIHILFQRADDTHREKRSLLKL